MKILKILTLINVIVTIVIMLIIGTNSIHSQKFGEFVASVSSINFFALFGLSIVNFSHGFFLACRYRMDQKKNNPYISFAFLYGLGVFLFCIIYMYVLFSLIHM